MECPRCRKSNLDDARFCESCGAPLARLCPECGRRAGADARFCAGCGVALDAGAPAAPAAADAGERRQLTVLFCDLVRSTELSSRLDPEDWGAALALYQKAGDAVVARFGGHVAQHLGDGLLAYFGWPQALDDAAERAVRAGLELVDTAAGVQIEGRALVARVGVHTGPVVMGALGGGRAAETLALGDVPNVAARVQAAAEPGAVLITGSTQRLVSGLFVLEEQGERALAGVPEPVALYRVRQASGVRGRLHAAATARRLTRFVGRQQERQLLRERWELAQEGEGQVVLVTGEPGIGKSRLVQQLKLDLASEPHSWIETAGSPYLQHAPFAPIVELLGQGFQWSADLPMDERIAGLERALEGLGMSPASAAPLIAPLLGLELPARYAPLLVGPEEQRRRLVAALVEWTIALSKLQPTVVVMEDLHWTDPSTLEVEGLLADQIATARVLLILTARPEFRPPWPLRAHHAQLSLARLSRRHTRELIGAVTSDVMEPGELVDVLIARTDGVPLFVEELTRAVVEVGAGSPREIPATLQDTLMARLDRLGDAKGVAQVGAVLGREFTHDALVAVAERPAAEIDAALGRLCDAELLHARGLGSEASYTFKHALVQQAAYESLLKSRRRELHRRAAQVLSSAAGSSPSLLAQHWEAAGEAQKAIAAWQAAAERARSSAASFEAAEHFRRALAVLEALPESAERDRQELALRYPLGSYLIIAGGGDSPEVISHRARLRELAERVGDPITTVNMLSSFWAAALVRGQHRAALAIAEQMLELAERSGAVRPLVLAHANKGMCHHQLGQLAESRLHGEHVLKVYDAEVMRGDPLDRRGLALSYLIHTDLLTGRFSDARRRQLEMTAAARASGVVTDIALALQQSLVGAQILREPAAEQSAELEALCAEHKLQLFGATAKVHSGWAIASTRSLDEGVALLRAGLGRLRALGQAINLAQQLGLLAEVLAIGGRLDESAVALDDAFAALGEGEAHRPEILRVRGDLLVRRGEDLDAAEAAYREALERAHAMGALLYELRAATGLARLWARRGRAAEAREILAPVYASFAEGFERSDLVEAKAVLDGSAA
jgi:class 3 adenylate cyclase/tetratricopeptide (TPR) repeat protein